MRRDRCTSPYREDESGHESGHESGCDTGHDTGYDDGSASRVEGYLLAHTHREQARREAEDLCARMPWLTTAQAEDVTAHYLRRRMDLTRQILLATTERAGQLREEYETRYAALRRSLLRRHAACACALLACAGLGTLASAFFR